MPTWIVEIVVKVCLYFAIYILKKGGVQLGNALVFNE